MSHSFFTPFITKAINFKYGYVFAGCNLAAACIVYFFVIEGRGRTLEEIDTMYLLGVPPWKSSKYVFPSDEELDEETRKQLAEARRGSLTGGSMRGRRGSMALQPNGALHPVRGDANGGPLAEKKRDEEA